MKYLKTIFHLLNASLIIFYLYPGSILGWLLYNDLQIQPQITRDFMISSNHVFAFSSLAFIGLIYKKSEKIMIIYLIFLAILLELTHYFIPNRSFQFEDLLGNLFGVSISLAILGLILFFKEKNVEIKKHK
ncbi:MAG: hypothetical protein CBE35_00925 [Candidatus Pelagibacter sp. TMED275]|nr:MAG: hypothetical protein CBE35_00925 [Candidatus Pelagibacter sp. TMED275]|tara:strand:+ start:2116 stop:2508 length:393 start_codon:yes stop_codon:yes gene_type:complete